MPYMKTALWIYFGAITLLCVSLSIAIGWFGRMIHHAHPGALLPWPTAMLIDYRAVLYAVPLPSLFFAVRGRSYAERIHIVGAYSFAVLVLLICVTALTVMIPFLPWGITLEFPK
jgi:hypothetical protein